MSKSDKKIGSKKVFDIISWIFIALLFILSLSLVLIRNAKGTIYLFNSRYDVVLTKSMSYKNESHLDFLEGHDNQIQPFDVVQSEKVNSSTELNIYDIVLFNNPYVGTDMHRIVNKEKDGSDDIYIFKGEYLQDNNLLLPDVDSYFYTNFMSYSTMEMVVECSSPQYNDFYNFNFNSKSYKPIVTITNDGDKYIHKYVLDNDTTMPGITTIAHKKEFDYSDHIIKSIKFNSYYGTFEINNNQLVDYERENTKLFRTNITYTYEIRGDAAKDSDGWYKIDQIYSRVTNVIPKVGYAIRYLSSPYGIIMLTGTAFIIIIVSFLIEKSEKKDKESKDEKK